jgi:hypothetical protein
MTKPWLRWYRETISDVKFKMVAEHASDLVWPQWREHNEQPISLCVVIATWAALLERADDAGTVTVVSPLRNGSALRRYISTALMLSEKEAECITQAMTEHGLLDQKGDQYQIRKWQQRQYVDVTNADRQARFRRNGKSNAPQPLRNAVTVTPTDTDTDIKKERGAKAPKKVCNENLFLEFWEVYPRKVARGDALKAYLKALSRASHAEILAGVKRYKPDPKFTKHPATWLNADCWLDEAPKSNGSVARGPWKPLPSVVDPVKPPPEDRERQLQRLMKARAM